jgi:spoIIIJ-associated protein
MEQKKDEGSQSAEYDAKSLEEALELASEDLGVSSQELGYEVVQDSTRSILGFVRAGEITVRAWVREVAVEEGLPVETAQASEEVAEEVVSPVLERNPPELDDVAREVISTLLDKMDIIAAIELVDSGGVVNEEMEEVSPLVLNIVGDDLGILIGRRGETLRDLQFIARLIINRQLGVWPNLVVDVEGYKARRAESLSALALRMADQVRRSGHTVVLEPMPAHERRIIHLTLRDAPDVYTESTGEYEHRKVQIFLN